MPEAEALVAPWRLAHTPDGRAGMPGHVTLLYPFASLAEVDVGGLGRVFAGFAPFDYLLGRIAEFPEVGVCYLAPEPAGPFVELTRTLVTRFPGYPPYAGQVTIDGLVPHVTVVNTDDDRVRAEAATAVEPALPIACAADEAWLVHEPDGRWRLHTSFRLGG